MVFATCPGMKFIKHGSTTAYRASLNKIVFLPSVTVYDCATFGIVITA